jgi:hypothetical protein
VTDALPALGGDPGAFPGVGGGVLFIDHVTDDVRVDDRLRSSTTGPAARLAGAPEGTLPEIQAWRWAFSRRGLKPTRFLNDQ